MTWLRACDMDAIVDAWKFTMNRHQSHESKQVVIQLINNLTMFARDTEVELSYVQRQNVKRMDSSLVFFSWNALAIIVQRMSMSYFSAVDCCISVK